MKQMKSWLSNSVGLAFLVIFALGLSGCGGPTAAVDGLVSGRILTVEIEKSIEFNVGFKGGERADDRILNIPAVGTLEIRRYNPQDTQGTFQSIRSTQSLGEYDPENVNVSTDEDGQVVERFYTFRYSAGEDPTDPFDINFENSVSVQGGGSSVLSSTSVKIQVICPAPEILLNDPNLGTVRFLATGLLDSHPDLTADFVAANDSKIFVIRNPGTSDLAIAELGGAAGLVDLQIVNLDGEGPNDLVIGRFDRIEFWAGNGDGTFQDAVTLVATNGLNAIAIEDLNGNGMADLLIAEPNRFRVLYDSLGKAPATAALIPTLPVAVRDFVLAPYDSVEGKDIIAATPVGVRQLSLSPDGATSVNLLLTDAVAVERVQVANFDGEPGLDLVYESAGSLWLKPHDAATAVMLAPAVGLRKLAVADLNVDAYRDLVITDAAGMRAYYAPVDIVNPGEPTVLISDSTISSSLVVEVTGDNTPDLVLAAPGQLSVAQAGCSVRIVGKCRTRVSFRRTDQTAVSESDMNSFNNTLTTPDLADDVLAYIKVTENISKLFPGYSSDREPREFLAADDLAVDFNGDGMPDSVQVSSNIGNKQSALAVTLNLSESSSQQIYFVSYSVEETNNTVSSVEAFFSAADFDNDGDPDLVTFVRFTVHVPIGLLFSQRQEHWRGVHFENRYNQGEGLVKISDLNLDAMNTSAYIGSTYPKALDMNADGLIDIVETLEPRTPFFAPFPYVVLQSECQPSMVTASITGRSDGSGTGMSSPPPPASASAGETVTLDGGNSTSAAAVSSYRWSVSAPDGSLELITDTNSEQLQFTIADSVRARTALVVSLTVTDVAGVSDSAQHVIYVEPLVDVCPAGFVTTFGQAQLIGPDTETGRSKPNSSYFATDVDGDGDADILHSRRSGAYRVFRNDGDDGFVDQSSTAVIDYTPYFARASYCADIDGVVTLNAMSNPQMRMESVNAELVATLPGASDEDGIVIFEPRDTCDPAYPASGDELTGLGQPPRHLAVDLNNDNRLDIIEQNANGALRWWANSCEPLPIALAEPQPYTLLEDELINSEPPGLMFMLSGDLPVDGNTTGSMQATGAKDDAAGDAALTARFLPLDEIPAAELQFCVTDEDENTSCDDLTVDEDNPLIAVVRDLSFLPTIGPGVLEYCAETDGGLDCKPVVADVKYELPAMVRYLPLADENGRYAFRFVVNGGTVDSEPKQAQFEITPVNDPPRFEVPSVFRVIEVGPDVFERAELTPAQRRLIFENFAESPAVGPINENQQLTGFELVWGETTYLGRVRRSIEFEEAPRIEIVGTGDARTGTLVLRRTANPEDWGNIEVEAKLVDSGPNDADNGDKNSTNMRFELRLNAAPIPESSPSSVSVNAGTPFFLNLTDSYDPDSNNLVRYRYRYVYNGVLKERIANLGLNRSSLRFETEADFTAGEHVYLVSVQDGEDAWSVVPDMVTVNIVEPDGPANTDPIARATVGTLTLGAPQTGGTLDASSSDDAEDGDTLAAYAWSCNVTLSDPGLCNKVAITPPPTAVTTTYRVTDAGYDPGGSCGRITFNLTVTDSDGNTGTSTGSGMICNAGSAASPTAVASSDTAYDFDNATAGSLSGIGSMDSGGGTSLNYSWTCIDAVAGLCGDVSIVNADMQSATFTVSASRKPDNACISILFQLAVADSADVGNTATTTTTGRACSMGGGGGGTNTAPNAMATAGKYYFDLYDEITMVDSNTDNTLVGEDSTDSDGSIASYAWSCTSDPAICMNVTITHAGPTESNARFSVDPQLDGGPCFPIEFKLTVTDNESATDSVFATGMACPSFGGGPP